MTVGFDSGLVVLHFGWDEPSYSMDPLAASCTHSATTARPHRRGYVPMVSYISAMGGSSLPSEVGSISTILLSRGGTRCLDLGTTYAMEEGRLKIKISSEPWETKDGAPNGDGTFGSGDRMTCLAGHRESTRVAIWKYLAKVDIRGLCVELREDSEASPRASAPRRSRDDGDMHERNDDCGSCIRALW